MLAVAGGLFLGACGGDDDTDTPNGVEGEPTRTTVTTATAPSGGGGDSSCPLTEEMVSEVLGTEMETEGACVFFPADGDKIVPSAGYNRQVPFAFNQDALDQEGYTEAVSGVGERAYTRRDAVGTWLLVDNGGQNFEVVVDTLDGVRDRELAIELAKRVIAGE